MDALDVTDAVLKPDLIIRQFNELTPYLERFQEMKSLTENRDENTPDELWILQHHDVLTQGQAGKPEHILQATQLPIVQSDRGGQVTWHGPGQLVAYFMFDLNRLGWNVRTLVTYAENLMINLLKKYKIEAYAKADAPGVYVAERKIGSLGFKIRKGRSYHGLALNIDCDLLGFQTINPCGYAGLEMVRVKDLVEDYPFFNDFCADMIETLNHSGYFNQVQVMQQ